MSQHAMELKVLQAAVREAGAAIYQMQQEGFHVSVKANSDLVTQADLLANDIILTRLYAEFPTYGWLSEETKDHPKRLQKEKVWVIDPIDGTIEYANQVAEYAISVALIEQGLPIIACVYNPATNEFFHACKNEGAWLNDKSIHCIAPQMKQDLVVLASRSEVMRGEWREFAKQCTVKPVGSIAYKMACVAAGKAHGTFSLSPKHEWDIAAGTLLVLEAGGYVTNVLRENLHFNRESVRVDGVVAGEPSAHAAMFDLIQTFGFVKK